MILLVSAHPFQQYLVSGTTYTADANGLLSANEADVDALLDMGLTFAIGGLNNVSISSVSDGDALMYSAADKKWINAAPAAPGASVLAGLSDVTISSPTNGQILAYSTAANGWENANGLNLAQVSWTAGGNPNNEIIFTAVRAMKVTGVVGRLEVANAATSTAKVVKAPSSVALSSGTALTSTTLNAAGTPTMNQTLTLSTAAADLALVAGDSLGVVTTGTWALSAGGITVHMSPD
jgi:hypothetical protein